MGPDHSFRFSLLFMNTDFHQVTLNITQATNLIILPRCAFQEVACDVRSAVSGGKHASFWLKVHLKVYFEEFTVKKPEQTSIYREADQICLIKGSWDELTQTTSN